MGQFLLVSLGLLVVAFSLNGIGADHHCPSDWFSFDKYCYKLIKQQKSWNDAETFCTQLRNSSHLASINSLAESLAVKTLIFRSLVFFRSVWIGLNDPENTRTWKWTDGSKFNYTSWGLMEPSNVDDGKDCVQLSSLSNYFSWEAVKCESNNFFICKMEPQSVGST